jgi:heme-degrading monooxygenase HmoA
MVLTVTTSVLDAEQLAHVESFLVGFLPRMREAPGVVEILHYADRESGRAQTLVVWESEADVRAYRESALVKEAMAFEKSVGAPGDRKGPFAVLRLA